MNAMLFHVLESEANQAIQACRARGINPPNEQSECGPFFVAMIEELDKLIPGAGLAKRTQEQVLVSVAVMAPGAELPDNRWQRDTRAKPFAQVLEQGEPPPANAPNGMGMIAARVAPTTAMQKKLDEIEDWQPLPEHQVQQIKAASETENMPWPTHQGTLKLDGQAGLKVYILSNGDRVIDAHDLELFFRSFGGL